MKERTDLFVYGTLVNPQLVRQITDHQFETRDAVIEGCYIAKNEATGYLEIREGRTTSTARGKVLLGVDSSSLQRLDDYEGDLYVRGEAIAYIQGEHEPVDVQLYIPRLHVGSWLRWILGLVGGDIQHKLGNPQGLREKCRSSLTSVSLVFLPLLHLLPNRLLAANLSPSSSLLFGTMAVLFVSALMLVLSFEFYDSGLNPYLQGLSIHNLEYSASPFYFCALWLTVLAVGLLISSLAWHIGMVAFVGLVSFDALRRPL